MESIMVCKEVRANEVIGPEVKGDLMSARKGPAILRAGMVVISS